VAALEVTVRQAACAIACDTSVIARGTAGTGKHGRTVRA
jgi:hypothetical protein